MQAEFQDDLLKFLVQEKVAMSYLGTLDSDIFDLDTHFQIFDLLKDFVKKYNRQPSLGNMLEYLHDVISKQRKKTNINDEVVKLLERTVRDAFLPLEGSTTFIKDQIIEQYQLKLLKDLIVKEASNLKTASRDDINEIYKKIHKIKQLGDGSDEEEEERNKGRLAIAEFNPNKKSIVESTPTYLTQLNRMTSTRGFYSPQLIIFMSGPKAFKTGTILNIAAGLVRHGKKVYYADTENGQERLTDRFYQALLEATFEEYITGQTDEILSELLQRLSLMGGDFLCDYFPAMSKNVNDVEYRLDELKEEKGFVPDVIIWDYPDNFEANTAQRENRHRLRSVYFDIIKLHKKLNVWGIGVSPVTRDAVNKPVIDMTAFAEDFSKAYNCHASFAICATDDEKEAKIRRIVPVLQRDGVAQHSNAVCYVYVDEERMMVKEIDKAEAIKLLEVVEAKKTVPDKKKGQSKLDLKKRRITDD